MMMVFSVGELFEVVGGFMVRIFMYLLVWVTAFWSCLWVVFGNDELRLVRFLRVRASSGMIV